MREPKQPRGIIINTFIEQRCKQMTGNDDLAIEPVTRNAQNEVIVGRIKTIQLSKVDIAQRQRTATDHDDTKIDSENLVVEAT